MKIKTKEVIVKIELILIILIPIIFIIALMVLSSRKYRPNITGDQLKVQTEQTINNKYE